ncbi:MAG: hypothetical protein OI715_01265 (plasmid) [Candidatus Methanoperedens sp.]|nr:MAG: hypothetical protein OI715_01265 [Candidatus Methanoperedens sp.]
MIYFGDTERKENLIWEFEEIDNIMENVNIELTSKRDTLFLSLCINGNIEEELYFDLTDLDEILTPEKMIDIWYKFKGDKFNIPLDKVVYYKAKYKRNAINSSNAIWIVFKLLYLLDKCSGIGKFEKFSEPGEQIKKIQRTIRKWGTTEEETRDGIKALDEAILSVIAELEVASILTENKFDIEFIDKKEARTGTGSRSDIKFIRNGLTADIVYATPYGSSPPTEDFITFKTMIKDLLINLRSQSDENHLEKADIIIINCMDLYYQQTVSSMLSDLGEIIIPPEAIDIDCDSKHIVFNILQIKDAMDKAFEIVKSCDKAMMLLFDGKRLSGGFRALVFPASFISSCIKYDDHRKLYEIKIT